MKKLIFGILATFLFVNLVFAQNDAPKITKAEIRQAQQLAARFYNRYAQTQDVEPLIKEFFISDFGKWYKDSLSKEDNEDNAKLKNVTAKDVTRFYASWINYYYLYFNSVNFVQMQQPKISDHDAERIVEKEIEKQILLEQQLGNKTFASLNASKQYDPRMNLGEDWEIESLRKTQIILYILRKVESKFRNGAKKNLPKTRFHFLPKDIKVERFENNEEFNFPEKTIVYDVWNTKLGSDYNPSNMFLVKEKRKLKVVMVIPPPK
ncbi:MAG TPA: hypothetical protein PKY82_09430 [Pyrinomonadaceae bacterium]|nr:hypothetical protein [Pyrinomonadaceae bacterium]